jgi:hypothetical protein
MTTTQQLPSAGNLRDLLRAKLLAGTAAVVLLAGGAIAVIGGGEATSQRVDQGAPSSQRGGLPAVSPQVARLTAEAALGLRVGAPVSPRLAARVDELAAQIERGRAIGTPVEP